MAEKFAVAEDEPEPVCANCDSWSGEPKVCLHIQKQTGATDGCRKFFPDPKRWPDADHD